MAQVRKRKKIRKLRGSRTCGYGKTGQHRKSGDRGGKGKAGRKKHKWTWVVKYAPNYFGKHGFKRPPAKQYKDRIINLDTINEKIHKLLEQKIAIKEGNTIHLDVTKLGYDKVLGRGKLTYPMNITAKKFSNTSIKKINEVGGQAIALEKSTEP
ncbi:MAG: uL15 family ribosomal protein [Candidatus Helarchaeota archaeon]